MYKKTSELIWQDTQHQTLLKLIDQLGTENATSDIFAQLSDYAESHFLMEETYMEVLNYPGMEAHKRAHDKFRLELNSMMLDQYEFDAKVRESVSIFLREWLTRHIFGIDKDFELFVLNSESK